MDEKKVLAFLRCSASAPVNLALEMANLTDHERTAVDLCGIRGLTYDEAAEEGNQSEVIIAKNRHGPTGSIEVLWMGEYTKFMNLEQNR